MNFIPFVRPASEDEHKQIAATADLTPTSSVWVWPNEGKDSDMAVLRQCLEVDPMYFAETSGSPRRGMFAWVIMNMLRVQGIKEIYFNVDAEGQEAYVALLEKMGAKRTTDKPQFRFKLEL